jgi:hypothetical protein
MEENIYKDYNIEQIKKYLKELLALDYSKLSTEQTVTFEHRLYYDIYMTWTSVLEGGRIND